MSGAYYDDPSWYAINNSPYMKEVIDCECGIKVQRRSYYRHSMRQQHQNWKKNPDSFNDTILCEHCGLEYIKNNKQSHIATEEHKSIIRERNKVKAKERAKEIIICGCGVIHTRNSTRDHLRTKKHTEWINKNK